MYKKFAFILILVFSLFITKDVFASANSWVELTGLTISNDVYAGPYIVKSVANLGGTELNDFLVCDVNQFTGTKNIVIYNNFFGVDEFPTSVVQVGAGNYCHFSGTPYYWVSANEPITMHPYDDFFLSFSTFNEQTGYYNSFSDGNYHARFFSDTNTSFYFNFSIVDGYGSLAGSTPPPLVSGIDKVSLYTLNNEDLSEITTPIPFDAGHEIFFFNYEENPYRYLAYNVTICHNGHLEGCTMNNETYAEDYYDISSFGFSSSGSSPFSLKLNFKDIVSQSDLINITWFLTNCPNAYSTCPGGVSAGRGYTYLINNSLASDSWLTFDDPVRPECTLARLDVCIINAVNYFIKPRTSGFANSFSVASTRINERIPFVYLYAVRDAFSDIFNSPTASVNWSVSFGSLGSLTVLDSDSFSGSPYYSFFTGMRVYLGYLLWILLGVGLYKRAVRLFDDKTVA